MFSKAYETFRRACLNHGKRRGLYLGLRLTMSAAGGTCAALGSVRPRWLCDSPQLSQLLMEITFAVSMDPQTLHQESTYSGIPPEAVISTMMAHMRKRKTRDFPLGPCGWSAIGADRMAGGRSALDCLALRWDLLARSSLRALFVLRHEFQHELQRIFRGWRDDTQYDVSAAEQDADAEAWRYLEQRGLCNRWGRLRWSVYSYLRHRLTRANPAVILLGVLGVFILLCALCLFSDMLGQHLIASAIKQFFVIIQLAIFGWIATEQGV